MNEIKIDFSQPRRQSYIAILAILGKTIWSVTRQILPAVAVIFLGGAKNKGDQIVYLIIGVAILTCIYSIINFFKTYFYVDDDELIYETGIFNKKRILIPFAKIQTIDSEQTLLHRVFDVTKIKVDTAGGDKTEFKLDAIDIEIAEGLRNLLIHKKDENQANIQNKNIENDTAANIKVLHQKEIMHIDLSELWRIGITSNHFKSSWIIIAFGVWIFNMLDEIGIDIKERYEDVDSSFFNFNILVLFLVFMIIVSISISLIRAIIKYFELRFYRTSKGFKIEAGLFTKKEVSAKDQKIQYVEWSQNYLQRKIGISEMTLHQASSEIVERKQKIIIPGMNDDQVDMVTDTLFNRKNIKKLPIKGIHKSFFERFSTIIIIIAITVSIVSYIVSYFKPIIIVSLLGIWFVINRYVQYRKSGYGYDGDHIWIKSGFIQGKYALLPIYKIQAINLLQSPYQRRNALCNINFITAAGQLGIPYIPYQEAKQMLDRFIYDVELNNTTWM